MKRSLYFLAFMATFSVLVYSCKKNNDTTGATAVDAFAALNLPATAFNYANPVLPAYLSGPNIAGQLNTPANNAITDNGATLGRVIFFDKTVSLNNAVSCASCHKQADAFSDVVKLSSGFQGGFTGRNSMSLINAAYYPNGKFFWDERAATLEIQTLTPIQDHTEMGMTLDTLVKRFSATSHYPVLFEKAFGDKNITSDRISKALSQYVRSIISYQSKYDTGRAAFPPNQNPGAVNFANYTTEENRGKEIFFNPTLSSCAACHGTETFTAVKPENNGLDLVTTDFGVGAITSNPANNGQFKVTSLRNVALTAPYMHDGRFTTLEQVVEHYSTGIKANPNLSPQLRNPNGTPRLLNLSASDKAALVAFLKTLTDTKVTTDVKYSNPFK